MLTLSKINFLLAKSLLKDFFPVQAHFDGLMKDIQLTFLKYLSYRLDG